MNRFKGNSPKYCKCIDLHYKVDKETFSFICDNCGLLIVTYDEAKEQGFMRKWLMRLCCALGIHFWHAEGGSKGEGNSNCRNCRNCRNCKVKVFDAYGENNKEK